MKIRTSIFLLGISLSLGLFLRKQFLVKGIKNTAKTTKAESQDITDKNIVAIVNGQRFPDKNSMNYW